MAMHLEAGCPTQVASGQCQHTFDLHCAAARRGDQAWKGFGGALVDMLVKGDDCPICLSWAAHCITTLAASWDLRLGDDAPPPLIQPTPEAIPHPRGAKRCRRMDEDLIKFACETMVGSKRFRSAARVAKGLCMAKKQTAGDMEDTYMATYLAGSYKALQGRSFIWLSMDQGRIGGEDNLLTAAWSHDAQIGAWLVPQACLSEWGAGLSGRRVRHGRHC